MTTDLILAFVWLIGAVFTFETLKGVVEESDMEDLVVFWSGIAFVFLGSILWPILWVIVIGVAIWKFWHQF